VEEALSLWLPSLFLSRPTLLRVSALLDESNTPAKGLLRRLGFRFEGAARDAVLQGGQARSRVMFGLTYKDLAGPVAEDVDTNPAPVQVAEIPTEEIESYESTDASVVA